MSSLCVRGKASLENSQESNKEKNESRDRWKLLFADVGSSFYDASSICCHSRSSTVRSPGSGIESSATHRSTSHHRNTAITHLSHTSTDTRLMHEHMNSREHQPVAHSVRCIADYVNISQMHLHYSSRVILSNVALG